MTESIHDPRSSLQELLARAQALLPRELRTVVDVVPLYRSLTAVWAQRPAAPLSLPAQGLVWAYRLHLYNFRLWHVEDGVRRPGASESFIAQSKRAIDTFNQQRHEQIEQLDMWLFACLYEHNSRRLTETELHSETPGNLLDRLSILTLKVYYMGCEAERQDATGRTPPDLSATSGSAGRAARRYLYDVCAVSVLISGLVGKYSSSIANLKCITILTSTLRSIVIGPSMRPESQYCSVRDVQQRHCAP